MKRAVREITTKELLSWARDTTPLVWVRTAVDAFPGGLSIAMTPAFVDWSHSQPDHPDDPHYILHNVNIGTNPVGGSTMLGTVKVPADSIEGAEFVLVISKVHGIETEAGHAMIRFVFKEDRQPEVLIDEGKPMGNDAFLQDLVFSWEAWRPPAASFDPVAGLNPETYALSMRAFYGPSRCLTDAILDRPWVCYPIQLPDVPGALDELLHFTLVLGDSVARETIDHLLRDRIAEEMRTPEDYPKAEAEELEQLRREMMEHKFSGDPIQELLDGKTGYHLLQRSCVTMALKCIDWANARIHRAAGLADPPRVRVTPEALPALIDDLAHGRRTSALLRIPSAIRWLMSNQTVMPAKSHELLDAAGLLKREDGELVRIHHDNRKTSPYAEIGTSIIY